MKKAKRKRLSKIVGALNGALFLMGAFSLFGEGKIFFGVLQLIASVFNFIGLARFGNLNVNFFFQQAILLMNVIVALSVAIDYVNKGTQYIQYVWMLTALLSLGVFVLFLRRKVPLND